MEYVTLNNGIKMPKLGYGVYQTPPEDTKRCVLDAIEVGYTMRKASVRRWRRAAFPVRNFS